MKKVTTAILIILIFSTFRASAQDTCPSFTIQNQAVFDGLIESTGESVTTTNILCLVRVDEEEYYMKINFLYSLEAFTDTNFDLPDYIVATGIIDKNGKTEQPVLKPVDLDYNVQWLAQVTSYQDQSIIVYVPAIYMQALNGDEILYVYLGSQTLKLDNKDYNQWEKVTIKSEVAIDLTKSEILTKIENQLIILDE